MLPRRQCALALFLFLFAGAAWALDRNEVPEGFGGKYYRADAERVPVLPPLQSAPEGDAWRQRIQEREWDQGPYGSDISETLQDAAFLERLVEDYQAYAQADDVRSTPTFMINGRKVTGNMSPDAFAAEIERAS